MLQRAPALPPLLEVFHARPQRLLQDRRRRARFGSHVRDGVRRAGPTFGTTARLSSELAPAADASYSVIGDCARATVIDPGIVTNVAGMLIQRGTVFECPLTGDIEGVARVVLNLTLRNVGPPQVEGRVFGESIFLVTKFFGRPDLNGTFEGPFNGSLEEVRFGAAKTNRHGTGDFAGLVLHGVAVQNPPGSGTEVENGRVVGGDEP